MNKTMKTFRCVHNHHMWEYNKPRNKRKCSNCNRVEVSKMTLYGQKGGGMITWVKEDEA